MFDLEQFAADCRAALAVDKSHKLVREVVARAVSDPTAVLKGIGEPQRAEVQKLYHAPGLTILNVIWGPMMTIMPHNHQMWARHRSRPAAASVPDSCWCRGGCRRIGEPARRRAR